MRSTLTRRPSRSYAVPTSRLLLCVLEVADTGDTTTMVETVIAAAEQVEAVLPAEPGMAEVVADKGYHSNETMVDLAAVGVRSYIAEPDRGRRCWKGAPEARDAVYANRRRIRAIGAGSCCGVVAPCWSVRSRIYMTRGAGGGCTCGAFEHSETGAGPCRGWQPRAASASSDRCRHAPWPPRAGRVGCMGADQTVGRPAGRSRAGLGAVSARFAVHSLATALSGLPALHLNTEAFCHGLLADQASPSLTESHVASTLPGRWGPLSLCDSRLPNAASGGKKLLVVKNKERTLANWNETDFEKNLKKVLRKKFARETGDAYTSLYIGARTTLLEDVLQDIRGSEPSLTDHGPEHIRHVLENVFKLLEGNLKYFCAIEQYILGLSVLFHDVGNLHGRKDHNKRIARFYEHVRPSSKFDQEKWLIVQIAQAHTGEALNGSRNTLADVPRISHLDGEPVRAREIAAIVRFADELAEGRQRTSEYMKSHSLYAAKSIPYHDYSAATDIAIDRLNHRIAITYQLKILSENGLPKELCTVKEFLKSACERLAKMDSERRYARFHCPTPLLPFREISACLNMQLDGEFMHPPLQATLSDEVALDTQLHLLSDRDRNWDPEVVADRVRQEVLQRADDEEGH